MNQQICPSFETVIIKEEIADNLEDGNVIDAEEALRENDEFSAFKNPEDINDNMQYSSSLCEERHIENFMDRVKKETEFSLIPEEIQIKQENIIEPTDFDSEKKSDNKLLDEYSALKSPEDINDNMQYSLCEERHIENFMGRVKKETKFNLIPEEIQIKKENSTEPTDYGSEDKSDNKLLDKFSAFKNPEDITDNMQYSSSLCEERHIENFMDRVKKETEFNLIPEEIQIKEEYLIEPTDYNSEDKSDNKLPDYNFTSSKGGKIGGLNDQNVDSNKRFKCDQCHKAFFRRRDQQRHIRTHTGERPFKCTICDKTYTRVENLTIHNRIHTGEKPYECAVCHKKFTQIHSLTMHKRVHTNERPFKCSVCQNTFRRSCDLSRHMRTHTGEKPYHCQVCQSRYTSSDNFKKHKRIHTGEKPTTVVQQRRRGRPKKTQ